MFLSYIFYTNICFIEINNKEKETIIQMIQKRWN